MKAGLGRGGGEGLVRALPVGVAGAELVERFVLDVEEATLLEVWHREPPASLHVEEHTVGENVTHGALRALLDVELGVGLGRVKLESRSRREARFEGVEEPLRKVSILDAFGTGLRDGGVEAAADEGHLHEVVEVAGLEGGVLAVVGKAQELLCAGLELALFLEVGDEARGDERRGTGTAAETDLAEHWPVSTAALVVRDATGRAELERARYEEAGEAVWVGVAVDRDALQLRNLRETGATEHFLAAADFLPIVGQPLENALARVVGQGPGAERIGAVEEVAGLRFGSLGKVTKIAGLEGGEAPGC